MSQMTSAVPRMQSRNRLRHGSSLSSVLDRVRVGDRRDGRCHTGPQQSARHLGEPEPDHVLDVFESYFVDLDEDVNFVHPAEQSIVPTHQRTPLSVFVVVSNILDIDTHASKFTAIVRLTLVWEVDLRASDNADVQRWADEAAIRPEGCYPLERDEIDAFGQTVEVPSVGLCNVMEQSDADSLGVRVCRPRGGKGLDVLYWNMAYYVTIRQQFDLRDFPFDRSHLNIGVELNNPTTWNKYDMTIASVVFHRDVGRTNEFRVDVPTVESIAMVERRKVVTIPIERHWKYYAHSLASLLFMLSYLTQLAFCCQIDDVGDRVNVVLTAFLAVVAIKFTLDLPKLHYVTILDNYMLLMMGGLFVSGVLSVTANKLGDLRERRMVPSLLADRFEDVDVHVVDFWCAVVDAVINLLPHAFFAHKALVFGRRSNVIAFADGRSYVRFDFARPFFYFKGNENFKGIPEIDQAPSSLPSTTDPLLPDIERATLVD